MNSIKKGDKTRDGYTPEDACKILEDNGADVVGLNCLGTKDDNETTE